MQTWSTHTHTCLTALFPGLPRWAGTRKVQPIWILLKQETVSGSGISWDICKSAAHSRQITTPAPHRSDANTKQWVKYGMDVWMWQVKPEPNRKAILTVTFAHIHRSTLLSLPIIPIAHTPAVKWPLTLMLNDIFRPCGWIVVLVKGCFPYVTACGKKTAHMHVIILSVHFSVL